MRYAKKEHINMTHRTGTTPAEGPDDGAEASGSSLAEFGIMLFTGIVGIGAVALLAHFLEGLSSEPKEDLLHDLFYSVMAGEDNVVAIDRNNLNSFAPFAKTGVIVAPDSSFGMRPVLFCLTGADGVMNSMIGDWDGLNVAKDTLISACERVLVERCQVALNR